MKFIIMFMFAVMPASADDGRSAPQVPLLSLENGMGNFEEDVAEASAKIKEEMRAFHANAMTFRIMDALQQHDPAMAQKTLKEMLDKSPELKGNSMVKLSQGEIYFWQGDFRMAYTENQEVIDRIEKLYAPRGPQKDDNPASENAFIADAYFNRATAGMRIGMAQQAVKDIEKAMLFRPEPYMALNKCRALIMLRKHKEAAEAFGMAFAMNPKTTESSDKKTICSILKTNKTKAKACEQETNQ